jgi:type 2 lantibiotic biosynthesis protein LanM
LRESQNTFATNDRLNIGLAKKRLQQWRSQSPFDSGSYFSQRLAMDGITEDEILQILGEPIEAVQRRYSEPPKWLTGLFQAFSRPFSCNPLSIPEMFYDNKLAEFLNAIEPLISSARERIRQSMSEFGNIHSALPFDPNTVVNVAYANLFGRIIKMLSRTMVLELHIARLQGLLKGDTPEDRFTSFLEYISQRDIALEILKLYPALAHQLVIRVDQWVNSSLQFLSHLCRDWEAICTTFTPDSEPGVLVQLYGGMGDAHKQGGSVMIAEFSSGFKVVYKPRSLGVDVHFQQLLSWLNERGDHPPFYTMKIVTRDDHGWVEFVSHTCCRSEEEVRHFYERQGGYLALLYALEATDFHFDNIIAAGENPVLIDLESLFHPRIEKDDTMKGEESAFSAIMQSVLRPLLLPRRVWSKADYEGVDMSGLGAFPGQLSPDRIPYIEGMGTDKMRYARKQVEMPGGQNRPTLNKDDIDVLEYTDSIIAGFTATYQLLIKYRSELLVDSGPLSCFATDEVRFIARQTRTYASLLYESFHPDLLHNALDRDRFFDRLWVGVKNSPFLEKLIPAEYEDLTNGDIPLFTTRPNSCALWSSKGERIADFFDASGMTLVQHRLQELSDQDLARQIWFIRLSLATLYESRAPAQRHYYSIVEPAVMPERDALHNRLLEAACTIGDRLDALALKSGEDISWIGLMTTNDHALHITPLDFDLYEGLSGIALFFGYLGMITQNEKYIVLAQTTLSTFQRQIEQSKVLVKSIGGYVGWGGVIYTLTHFGVLWDKPALLDEAEKVVDIVLSHIDQDEDFDIISGSSGCIRSLLSLYHCKPSDILLSAASQCGERLLAMAVSMDNGIGWINKSIADKPLAGFSHGAAGIAWALLELAELTKNERFRTAALTSMTYERSLFSAAVGNWIDLRELKTASKALSDEGPSFMTAWCHGAPGIGLARLNSLRYLDDPEIRAEIEVALRTTLTQGFGGNHCLCHGDLGNIDFLLQASEKLNDSKIEYQVRRMTTVILNSIDTYGWLSGIGSGVEIPGLMVGLAGIGYELLRLAEPKRVPSVLILESPTLGS